MKDPVIIKYLFCLVCMHPLILLVNKLLFNNKCTDGTANSTFSAAKNIKAILCYARLSCKPNIIYIAIHNKYTQLNLNTDCLHTFS